MAYEMKVDTSGVLHLAKDLLEKCDELGKCASEAQDAVDRLSLSFKDDSFAKVDQGVHAAIDGYEKMRPYIEEGAAGLVEFSDSLS